MGIGFARWEGAEVSWKLLYDEVIFVIEGCFELIANGHKYEVRPGQMLWIPEGTELIYGGHALFGYVVHPGIQLTPMGCRAANLGVNYHFELPSATKVDLAYFAADGGHYHGASKDSARYTANVVTSSEPLKTDLNEKNMWMARVDQDLRFLNTDDFKMSVGGSYWYSDIENKKTSADGTRNTWALFNRINYKNLNVVLTGGRQSISNKDTLSPASSTFGSFDGEYDIANKGYFYTVDTSYVFKNIKDLFNVTPYVVFSGFNKKESRFKMGLTVPAKHEGVAFGTTKYYFFLYTEYVMSKNDPFVGGTGSSLAGADTIGEKCEGAPENIWLGPVAMPFMMVQEQLSAL
ncbi:hypothetical protein FQR65_LT19393 [Abscondita terminalis]|nr:hypothetical protein FQR65_LT19393 [Abscondita terminalis]